VRCGDRIYPSIAAASAHVTVSYSHFCYCLKNGRPVDGKIWEFVKEQRGASVRCKQTGEIYRSAYFAEKATKISRVAILRSARLGWATYKAKVEFTWEFVDGTTI
jgi:hypothetical protein